ncbi:NAD(P)/FAD-dependent oxidoreductase [Actinomadura barringtoniae]|uniref:NAD(P)/FAD-dependent oxidoreductase n=1 Tax=Actinomadura barringtoniae TaxID=1427535 RepID=A0A939T7S0_9ACTN|nr:NAD(P)/FAD-dependent oxidoreductase [Actinomadura barringtoniae]MBO2449572.1 NAD(P)/FAD-dependent oxidoreductase [Actinomadura barringtoniae]
MDHEVIIVGAGFAGIGAGIALKRAGIEDFVLLERAGDIGGTWRDNSYPGLAVDIPSPTYSFAFEPRPTWSRMYARGPEIKSYADHCASKYGIRPHVRLNSTVTGARFAEDEDLWHVELADGATLTGRYLLSCQGALTTPSVPEIEGLDDFTGHTVHTARWDHDHDLKGERVAVIGTGATALQLIPEIAKDVAHLDVYQRTPIWVYPKVDPRIPRPVQELFRRVPATQRAMRLFTTTAVEVLVTGVVHHRQFAPMVRRVEKRCLRHLKKQVKDPLVREELTPRYGFGCKRPSFSNDYLRTFNRANVALRTEPIERITKTGIRTKDGREHEIDTLILATGFKVFDISFPIVGREGTELTEFWRAERRQSYEGASVPRFPNLFLVPGPYGNIGLSWFQMIDAQIRHALRVITETRRRGATRAEVRPQAHDRYMSWVTRRMPDTVFLNGNCATANSYYFDEHGDAPWQRPSTVIAARRRSRTFPLEDYEYTA